MINRSNTKIKSWAIHEVSGTQAQALHFSKEQATSMEPGLADTVLAHVIDIYKEPIYSGLDTLSPVYTACKKVFESQTTLYEESIALSRRFQQGMSGEPVKPVYLMYLWLEDLLIEDELLQGLAVVLLEGRTRYLDVTAEGGEISLWLQNGFLVGKPDAACLILDTDEESGYKVLNTEHTSRSGSKHWTADYLQLSPKGNDYSYTSDYIKLTSSFLKNRKPIEQILDKKDGVEALGRSYDYFKSNENFDEKQYKKEVFREDAVIEAFDDYKHRWQEKTQRPLADAFEASPEALQKQSKVFRSVIKLDRNFHVYVHGDHDMIQKGVDEHGRKYYILYYHEES